MFLCVKTRITKYGSFACVCSSVPTLESHGPSPSTVSLEKVDLLAAASVDSDDDAALPSARSGAPCSLSLASARFYVRVKCTQDCLRLPRSQHETGGSSARCVWNSICLYVCVFSIHLLSQIATMKRWGFVIRNVSPAGDVCGVCPWYSKCPGCPVLPTAAAGAAWRSGHLAIDWDPVSA